MAIKINPKLENAEEFSEAVEAVKEAVAEVATKINVLNDTIKQLNAVELKLTTTIEEE